MVRKNDEISKRFLVPVNHLPICAIVLANYLLLTQLVPHSSIFHPPSGRSPGLIVRASALPFEFPGR
jgi:hypothetical protein